MKTSQNISITMPQAMIKDAERLAKKEGRTISELFRETLRRYVWEQEWNEINAYGSAKAKAMGITEKDVNRLIQEYRREQRKTAKK